MLTSFLALTRVIYALNALACTRSAGWRSGIKVCSVGFTALGKLQWYHLMQGYGLKRVLCQWRASRCDSVSKKLCESSKKLLSLGLSLWCMICRGDSAIGYISAGKQNYRRSFDIWSVEATWSTLSDYFEHQLLLTRSTGKSLRDAVVFSMSNLLYLASLRSASNLPFSCLGSKT